MPGKQRSSDNPTTNFPLYMKSTSDKWIGPSMRHMIDVYYANIPFGPVIHVTDKCEGRTGDGHLYGCWNGNTQEISAPWNIGHPSLNLSAKT